MPTLRSLFRGPRPAPAPVMDAEPAPATDALLEMSTALLAALEARNDEMDLAGHAQRVADLADRLAVRHGIADGPRAALRQAALLHEIGMIGAPAELLHKPEPLTAEELARVHAQAEVGAAVARAVAGELAATLIRHQYDDEPTLRRVLGEGTEAYQLTLLLRAADVADVVSRARTADGSIEEGLRFVARDLESEALAA
jgi:HD domain